MKFKNILLFIFLGASVGMGCFTLYYAKGLSYLSNDPKACVNCHVMSPQYESWLKSSHHHVAVCNDCHIPKGFFKKYLAKAENGYHHSVAFTLQNFHEPIMIKEKNSQILQNNCISCHGDLAHPMLGTQGKKANDMKCVHCHSSVGHGETGGLGAPQ